MHNSTNYASIPKIVSMGSKPLKTLWNKCPMWSASETLSEPSSYGQCAEAYTVIPLGT